MEDVNEWSINVNMLSSIHLYGSEKVGHKRAKDHGHKINFGHSKQNIAEARAIRLRDDRIVSLKNSYAALLPSLQWKTHEIALEHKIFSSVPSP